jgi:hypothetical protein
VEVVRDKKVGGSPRPERSGSPRRRWPRPGQTPLADGPGGRSPEVKARVPAELKHRLEREAKRHGATTSTLIRDAFDRYLRGA